LLTHIDLFSGIGGFALAAQWAGFRTEVFCEIDKFCQEVIRERFGAVAYPNEGRCSPDLREVLSGREGEAKPNPEFGRRDTGGPSLLIPDIRDFDGRRFRGATLLTGGFPCQPFSVAGKRKGKADDRHLWPEMLRVISEARPTWVIGENVAGIINMELEQVCVDLEGKGYEVQPVVIPACAVNAPHRRSRVWIIANRISDYNGRTDGPLWGKREPQEIQQDVVPPQDPLDGRNGGRENPGRGSWDSPWPEVATRLCRMDDGIPRRVDRLKALGNAIVPQVAYEIIKAIAEIERG
jgi:DNA (cytosine-5)-methyltransferase 1